jgi:hypothetical protein
MSLVQVQGVPWFDAVTVLACAVCGLVRWWMVSRAVRRQAELMRQVLLVFAEARRESMRDTAGAASSNDCMAAGLSVVALGQLCTQLGGARVGEGVVVGERG